MATRKKKATKNATKPKKMRGGGAVRFAGNRTGKRGNTRLAVKY